MSNNNPYGTRISCIRNYDLTLFPIFLPPKDDKYWNRRYKNNEAAKRSRDARRLKENQISVRAAFLERENAALRQEVADMRKELGRCRNIISKYENRHGDLWKGERKNRRKRKTQLLILK